MKSHMELGMDQLVQGRDRQVRVDCGGWGGCLVKKKSKSNHSFIHSFVLTYAHLHSSIKYFLSTYLGAKIQCLSQIDRSFIALLHAN